MSKIRETLKQLLSQAIFELAMEERKSPLNSKEEEMAKHMKPALKSMQRQYGKDRGKEIYYGHIRDMAKKQKSQGK
jgi:hypothetical protein